MNYPYGNKRKVKSNYTYANRGMTLEHEIGESNKYYLDNDIAVIYKKPTPITISKVDYPSRLDAVITEGYFKTPSTTDYNGIYKGKYIDFEAKETKSKSSFPLSNIHKHQIKHLKKIVKHGGIGFLIIRFSTINKTYLLFVDKLLEFIDNYDRKSIPLSYFEENAYIIKDKYKPMVDYLEIVDMIYFKN